MGDRMKKFILIIMMLVLVSCAKELTLDEAFGADAKVSALPELTVPPAGSDTLYIIDDTVSKRITVNTLMDGELLKSDSIDDDSIDFGEGTDQISLVDFGLAATHDTAAELDALYQPLEVTLTDIADGTITENLANTSFPWADDEVADDITAGSVVLDDNSSVQIDATADGMVNEGYNGITITGLNAGEAIPQGNLVYFSATDNEWMAADANVAGKFPARGVALSTGSNGAALEVLVTGVMRHDDWSETFVVGAPVYLSATITDNAGVTVTAPSTSGDCVQIVGFALTDDEIYFDFSRPYAEVE